LSIEELKELLTWFAFLTFQEGEISGA